MIDSATGLISTIAGNGNASGSGDGFAAISARINGPIGLSVDPVTYDVYIADTNNNRIRLGKPPAKQITYSRIFI